MALRIVIADDHPAFRRALHTAIAADPRIEVVAEVRDLRSARSAVLRHRAGALVVDAGVVEADGGALGPLPAGITVIVVGMDDAPGLATHARRLGAAGYVVKDDTRRLVDALLTGADDREVSAPARATAPRRPRGRPARPPGPWSPPPAEHGPSAPH